MKIAVTGKGGVGKTTFAATLARLRGGMYWQPMWIRMRIWDWLLDFQKKSWIRSYRSAR